MKTLKMIAVLAFAGLATNAQDLKVAQVPSTISTEFQKSYPQAKDVEWELKGTYYKVEFDLGRYDHEISYDANGKVIREEKEVSSAELPLAITKMIKSKYPEYKVDKVEVTKWNGKTSYEVEIEQGWIKERKLVFNNDLKLISDLED